MHELSIAQSIFESVTEEMQRQNIKMVEKIVVRVGALSGVLPDALEFGFEAITIDTHLQDCQFLIEQIPVRGKCNDCQEPFEIENFLFRCPACFSGQIEVTEGYELEIAYLEVQEESTLHKA